MNKITLFRTHIEIADYDMGDYPPLEKKFSVWEPNRFRYFPLGRIYDKEKRILMLPRGIDIGYLERIFQSEAVINKDMDGAADIGAIGLRYKPRDEDQEESLKFMLSLGKYEMNKHSTMLSLNLNTGKGKSYCSIAAMAYMRIRTMVIADSLEILNQWQMFITEYTDIAPSEIYLIAGAPSVAKLYKRDISKYKVILATHGTILSVGKNQGWEQVHELFKYLKIGIKIYDEAHLNFENMFYIDCYSNSYITYYITATPGRSDLTENTIYGLYFKNVPCIDLFHEDKDPHTKYLGIKYNSAPSPMDISKCKNAYGLNRIAYTNYVVDQENFHKLLHILIHGCLKKQGKTLMYIGTNVAIIKVRNWIYENYPELIGNVGIYTSVTNQDVKRKELDKKIILTTTKSAGVAIDITGLVETINLAEPFKSRVLAQQTLGRTRGKDTVYKDIVDTAFLYTKKFYEFKKPVFSKYATECKEININNELLTRRAEEIVKAREGCYCPVTFVDPSYNNFYFPVKFHY